MRFDWYQATVEAHPFHVIDMLGQSLGAVDIQEGGGRFGYKVSQTLVGEENDRLAVVLSGGANPHPNITGSGVMAEDVARTIREHWSDHRVTRVDAAEDMIGIGSYDRLLEPCQSIARGSRVKGISFIPDDLADGRSYYMGSATSDMRVRLYDKTAETRSKLPAERHSEVPEGWSRLECQCRPRRDLRDALSLACPNQVWGSTKWTLALARACMALNIDRIERDKIVPSSDAQAFAHLLHQYGPLLARMRGYLGEDRLFNRLSEGIDAAQERADRR